MKTGLVIFTFVIATANAFAQGKITLGNDPLHLIGHSDFFGFAPIPQGQWGNLTMQLMGGSTAGSMTLQTTIVGNAIGNSVFDAGRLNNATFTLTGVAASSTAFLQLLFFNTAAGSYSNAVNNPSAYTCGASPVFTATTGSFAYNSIVLHGSPGFSTWPDAPVVIPAIPEPSTGALLAIGAAVLWRHVRWRHRVDSESLSTQNPIATS